MAASNYEQSIELIFGHEGGYVNNPKDPGGPTKYGITLKTLSAWRNGAVSAADVKKLTLSEASRILRMQYWGPVRCDELPAGLEHAVFDYAVNSGPAQAVRTLQRIVGTEPDGIMGVRTLAAVGGRDAGKLIDQLCDARLAFLRGLKTWRSFGKGWASRVERVRREARGMFNGCRPLQLSPPVVGLVQAKPADLKATASAEARAAALAGIGVFGTACADAARQIEPYAEMSPAIRWLFLALAVAGVGIGLYATVRRIRTGDA